VDDIGYPIQVCEMLSTLNAPYFIERVSLLSATDVMKAKKVVKKALLFNKEGRGFTFVEFVSTCPTNWGLSPQDAMKWAKENMREFFPIKNFRDKSVEGGA